MSLLGVTGLFAAATIVVSPAAVAGVAAARATTATPHMPSGAGMRHHCQSAMASWDRSHPNARMPMPMPTRMTSGMVDGERTGMGAGTNTGMSSTGSGGMMSMMDSAGSG